MKKTFILLLFAATISLLGCSKDNKPIEGYWDGAQSFYSPDGNYTICQVENLLEFIGGDSCHFVTHFMCSYDFHENFRKFVDGVYNYSFDGEKGKIHFVGENRSGDIEFTLTKDSTIALTLTPMALDEENEDTIKSIFHDLGGSSITRVLRRAF